MIYKHTLIIEVIIINNRGIPYTTHNTGTTHLQFLIGTKYLQSFSDALQLQDLSSQHHLGAAGARRNQEGGSPLLRRAICSHRGGVRDTVSHNKTPTVLSILFLWFFYHSQCWATVEDLVRAHTLKPSKLLSKVIPVWAGFFVNLISASI